MILEKKVVFFFAENSRQSEGGGLGAYRGRQGTIFWSIFWNSSAEGTCNWRKEALFRL